MHLATSPQFLDESTCMLFLLMWAYICCCFVVELAGYFAEVAHFAHIVYFKLFFFFFLVLVFSLVPFVGFPRSNALNLLYNLLKEHYEHTLLTNIVS